MKAYSLPYGQTNLDISIPAERDVVLLHPPCLLQATTPEPDQETVIRQALAHPVGSEPLRSMAKPGQKVTIIISDGSRLCPTPLLLPAILEELQAAGVTEDRIQILVALGLHRRHTEEELKQLVGPSIYRRIRVLNHSPLPEDCIHLGTTSRGTPVEINRQLVEADLVIATGNVEPHRLAGLSGGLKAVVPGCASRRTIEANHRLMLTAKAEPGKVANPVREDLEEAANYLPVHFLLNVVVDPERRLLAAASGHPVQAHRKLADIAGKLFWTFLEQPADLVIASCGGHPKDIHLYQALKTLQNAAEAAKPGAPLLLLARCGELYGSGAFQEWVETHSDRQRAVSRLQDHFRIGAHKLLAIDSVLAKHRVYLCSDMPPSLVNLVGFEPIGPPRLQATLERLIQQAGPGSRLAVMPYGAVTYVRKDEQDDLDPLAP